MPRKPVPRRISVAMRLDRALVQQIDAFAVDLKRREPGIRGSRSDAIRTLILRGLQAALDKPSAQR